jgi:23S rRNA (adenine2503-C2)-methyltransferase
MPLAFTPKDWESRAKEMGLPAFRGRQIFDAIHRRGVTSFEAMTELSRADRRRFQDLFPMALPEVVRREASADGSVKYALRLSDDALIEAVFMPRGEALASAESEFADARAEGPGGRSAAIRPPRTPPGERATLCLSSQTGCAVDCRFCVTGRLGAGRNLSGGEIVGQYLAVRREHPDTSLSLVFMGMGEPMLNFENVAQALKVFTKTISPRRITVSTAGFPDGIRRLGELEKVPNLAVSINAADERTREEIMPVTRAHPLAEVLAAMKAFPLPPRRRITAEYVLIDGVNDSVEDAKKLGRLLRGLPVKINVIPLNPDPRYLPEFQPPSETAIDAFVEELARQKYTVTVRRSRGPDSYAGCGQLKGRAADSRRR